MVRIVRELSAENLVTLVAHHTGEHPTAVQKEVGGVSCQCHRRGSDVHCCYRETYVRWIMYLYSEQAAVDYHVLHSISPMRISITRCTGAGVSSLKVFTSLAVPKLSNDNYQRSRVGGSSD